MKVLIAVDNSEHSRVPVDVLLMREWPKGSEIRVISTVDHAKSEPEAAAFVKTVCDRIKAKLTDATVSSTVQVGDAKDLIIDESTKMLADLVILGARGMSGLQRVFLGSVSQSVLMYGPCNTLIARHEKEELSGNLEKVLVAIDKSFHSKRAFDWSLDLPWRDGTSIKLVSVLPPIVDKYTDGFSALYTDNVYVEQAQAKDVLAKYVSECASQLKTKYGALNISSEILEGEPGEAILKTATDWQAGLIIMGSRGHGGIAKFWLGSVSQSVVLEAPCPVEVIKAQG